MVKQKSGSDFQKINRMKIKSFEILLLFFFAFFTACAQPAIENQHIEELVFQSGFEADSKVVPSGNDADIEGIDKSFSSKNDWVNDFDNHPDVGNFSLQYQGGIESQRFARIIEEPGNPSNHVLQFWLNEPNVEGKKGRIQANIYGNSVGWKEFYQSVRIYLPEDFHTVQKYPEKINWLTIAEYWNNITWSQSVPNRFRITLGIGKPVKGEGDLYFILDGQDCELFENGSQKYTTLWDEINTECKSSNRKMVYC